MGPLRLPFNGGASGFKHPAPNPFPDPATLPATAEGLRVQVSEKYSFLRQGACRPIRFFMSAWSSVFPSGEAP